jgi:hypothetical protein
VRRVKPPVGRNRIRKMGYRPPFQMNRMHWEFHSYDADPFPSVPHGHSVDSLHKLNPHSGDIYNGKKVCGTIKKKEYDRLWRDPRFNKYVEAAKQYREQNEKKAHLRSKLGHKWRVPRRRNPIFTFTTEVEMYVSEQE